MALRGMAGTVKAHANAPVADADLALAGGKMTLPFGELLLQAAGPLLFDQFGGATDLKGALNNLVACAGNGAEHLGRARRLALAGAACRASAWRRSAPSPTRSPSRSTPSSSRTCRSRPVPRFLLDVSTAKPKEDYQSDRVAQGKWDWSFTVAGATVEGAVDLRGRPHRRRPVSREQLATEALPRHAPALELHIFRVDPRLLRRQNRTLTHDGNRSRPGRDRHRSNCSRGSGFVVRGFAETDRERQPGGRTTSDAAASAVRAKGDGGPPYPESRRPPRRLHARRLSRRGEPARARRSSSARCCSRWASSTRRPTRRRSPSRRRRGSATATCSWPSGCAPKIRCASRSRRRCGASCIASSS